MGKFGTRVKDFGGSGLGLSPRKLIVKVVSMKEDEDIQDNNKNWIKINTIIEVD